MGIFGISRSTTYCAWRSVANACGSESNGDYLRFSLNPMSTISDLPASALLRAEYAVLYTVCTLCLILRAPARMQHARARLAGGRELDGVRLHHSRLLPLQ